MCYSKQKYLFKIVNKQLTMVPHIQGDYGALTGGLKASCGDQQFDQVLARVYIWVFCTHLNIYRCQVQCQTTKPFCGILRF